MALRLLQTNSPVVRHKLEEYAKQPKYSEYWKVIDELGPRTSSSRLAHKVFHSANGCIIVGRTHAESVPPSLITAGEIRDYLRKIMEGNEEWRAMKVVVLGNGKIGKSTLIYEIKKTLDPMKVCSSISAFL